MGASQTLDGCCGVTKTKNNEEPDVSTFRDAISTEYEVPQVLLDYLAAREEGDLNGAVACCSENVILRGPMGQFVGIDAVKAKAFNKPSQPLGRILNKLSYLPELSDSKEAVFAREFEAQIGYSNVPLRQEFHVVDHGTPRAKVSLVVFSKLVDRSRSPGISGSGY